MMRKRKRRHTGPAPAAGTTGRGGAGTPGRGVTGRLWRHADGFGFVTPAEPAGAPDIFIPRHQLANALHGDLVEFAVVAGGRGGRSSHAGGKGQRGGYRGPTGRILRVVERASTR